MFYSMFDFPTLNRTLFMMTGQIHLHFDMFYKPSAPNSRTQLLLYNSTDFLRVLLSQLLSLLNNFLNGTHHVEGLLRQ